MGLVQPCVRRNKGSHSEKKAPMEVRKFYLNYVVQGELEPRLNSPPLTPSQLDLDEDFFLIAV